MVWVVRMSGDAGHDGGADLETRELLPKIRPPKRCTLYFSFRCVLTCQLRMYSTYQLQKYSRYRLREGESCSPAQHLTPTPTPTPTPTNRVLDRTRTSGVWDRLLRLAHGLDWSWPRLRLQLRPGPLWPEPTGQALIMQLGDIHDLTLARDPGWPRLGAASNIIF